MTNVQRYIEEDTNKIEEVAQVMRPLKIVICTEFNPALQFLVVVSEHSDGDPKILLDEHNHPHLHSVLESVANALETELHRLEQELNFVS